MTTQQHTPTLWAVTRNGHGNHIHSSPDGLLPVAVCNISNRTIGQGVANAAFIVRACNAHDTLVAALEAALTYLGDKETDPSIEAAALRGDILNALAKAGRA